MAQLEIFIEERVKIGITVGMQAAQIMAWTSFLDRSKGMIKVFEPYKSKGCLRLTSSISKARQ